MGLEGVYCGEAGEYCGELGEYCGEAVLAPGGGGGSRESEGEAGE